MKRLPRLCLIADGFTDPGVAERVAAAVEGGVEWVQFRDRAADEAAFALAAERLAVRLHTVRPDVVLSVNTRVEVAERIGAGLHVGVRGPSVEAARRRMGEGLVGYSAHAAEETRQPVEDSADYVFFSPVFPTASKPGQPGVGLDALEAACSAADAPVLALGGVSPERVEDCLRRGAHGVAVLSGLLHAADPAEAAQVYLAALAVQGPV